MAQRRDESSNAVTVMLIAAHPDDEGIFGGGTAAYYAQRLGLNVVILSMCATGDRLTELCAAADRYAGNEGVGSKNDFGHYRTGNVVVVPGGVIDCYPKDAEFRLQTNGNVDPYWINESPKWSWLYWASGWTLSIDKKHPPPTDTQLAQQVTQEIAGREKASNAVAEQIRRYRPDVVVCAHSLQGDYGHTNHIATAIAAVEGVARATVSNDPSATPTAGPLANHGVSKLYLHGDRQQNRVSYVGNPSAGAGNTSAERDFASSTDSMSQLFHDHWEVRNIRGSSARQITDRGLRQHYSQYYLYPQVSTVYSEPMGRAFRATWVGNESEIWTLYQTKVEADTGPQPDFEPYRRVHDKNLKKRTTRVASNSILGDFLQHVSVVPAPPPAPQTEAASAANVSVFQFTNGATRGSLECIGESHWQRFGGGDNQPTYRDKYFERPPDEPDKDKQPVLWATWKIEYDAWNPTIERWTDGQRVILVAEPAKTADGAANAAVDQTHEVVLNMKDRKVLFPPPDGGSYSITDDIGNQRVNGRLVLEVRHAAGKFAATADADQREWTEFNDTGTAVETFSETHRDMWSAYLVGADGSRRQLDMHRLRIRSAPDASSTFIDLHEIIAAR